MNKIRILLADDHVLMRMGLSTLIACEDDMAIVGEAKNGREAVDLTQTLKPDLVIMDLMMPELSGAEATRLIRAARPDVKIMILTSFATSKEMSEAITNGADGTLMKDTAANDLIDAVRRIMAGEKLVPEQLRRQAEEDNSVPELTERHLEILKSVSRGYSNADIAKQLGLSEISIKKQMTAIYERLGVFNRTEAVALALRKQLIKA